MPVKTEARGRGAPKDAKPWTPPEIRVFLVGNAADVAPPTQVPPLWYEGIRDDRDYPVFLLSLLGLRPEEISGLYWHHIDLDAEMPTLKIARVAPLIEGVRVESEEAKSEAAAHLAPT